MSDRCCNIMDSISVMLDYLNESDKPLVDKEDEWAMLVINRLVQRARLQCESLHELSPYSKGVYVGSDGTIAVVSSTNETGDEE